MPSSSGPGPSAPSPAPFVFPAERIPATEFQVVTFEEAPRAPAPPRRAPEPGPAAPEAPAVDLARLEAEHARALAAAEERGRQRGRTEALAEARAEREREVARLRGELEGALGALTAGLDKVESEASRDAVLLGLTVAEKLARRALEVDPEALQAMLLGAAERLEEGPRLRLSVAPGAAGAVRAQLDAIAAGLGAADVELTEDPRLAPGDAILHRGSSTLDARIGARLARIHDALVRELGLEVDPAGARGPAREAR
jgi:flagellar biosynthesis/type III secretory pathway protein FliH